jgi:hypothetical protein
MPATLQVNNASVSTSPPPYYFVIRGTMILGPTEEVHLKRYLRGKTRLLGSSHIQARFLSDRQFCKVLVIDPGASLPVDVQRERSPAQVIQPLQEHNDHEL